MKAHLKADIKTHVKVWDRYVKYQTIIAHGDYHDNWPRDLIIKDLLAQAKGCYLWVNKERVHWESVKDSDILYFCCGDEEKHISLT